MKDYFKTISIIILTILIFSALGWGLYVGGMFVERQAIKASHQYKEGMEQKAANLEAQILEAEQSLYSTNDQEVKKGIERQIKVLKAQLRATITVK